MEPHCAAQWPVQSAPSPQAVQTWLPLQYWLAAQSTSPVQPQGLAVPGARHLGVLPEQRTQEEPFEHNASVLQVEQVPPLQYCVAPQSPPAPTVAQPHG